MSTPDIGQWLDTFAAATDELSTATLALGNCTVSRDGKSLPSDMPGTYIAFLSMDASLQLGLLSTPNGCQTIAKALLGMAPTDEDMPQADLADALGEVLNIIAGGVKARLISCDPTIKHGLPFFARNSIETKLNTECAVASGSIGEYPVNLVVLRQPQT